jgi:hypothetical protein
MYAVHLLDDTQYTNKPKLFGIVRTPLQILAIMHLLEHVVCTIHNSFWWNNTIDHGADLFKRCNQSSVRVAHVPSVQRDWDRLCAWCDVNKLYLNVRKCKVITFSRAKVQVTFDYSLNGQNLERVSVIRDSGVLMDSKLILSKIKKRCFNKPKLL